MVDSELPALGPEALAAAKAYLRVSATDEDALIAGLLRSMAELCEAFTGLALIERDAVETIDVASEWRRLTLAPVRAITGVAAIDGAALAVDAYAIDIDARGEGRVRTTQPIEALRLQVTYRAGMAADWAGVPDALRQGIVRMTVHDFTHRDGRDDPGPPAAVTALWMPWRRIRL